MSGAEHSLTILMGEKPWIAEDGTRPDGRWLARDAAGCVTLVKRRGGAETIAFQPLDFAGAERLAHGVIAGDAKTITDPLTLAALAAVIAEMGLLAREAAAETAGGPQ